MEGRIELITLPVTDVERAKAFYTERLGFDLDFDLEPSEGVRAVGVRPQGSGCAVLFGVRVTDKEPGSIEGIHLVVDDIHATRAELIEGGVGVSEVQFMAPGVAMAYFQDPDGNTWALREVTGGPATAG
jgi:catechol 2,3-dioxygenase-like lactoylglutathione lyase family enzyme